MRAAIRAAEAGDAPAIRAIHRAAFPTPLEGDLVEALARDGDVVSSLVAESQGELLGHVLLSRMEAIGDGRIYRAVGLAPVAVRPEHQGVGIGSELVLGALAAARRVDEEIVFVVGAPDYYRRFGFSADAARPFASPYAGPYFMAARLRDGVALPFAGTAAYAAAFCGLGDIA